MKCVIVATVSSTDALSVHPSERLFNVLHESVFSPALDSSVSTGRHLLLSMQSLAPRTSVTVCFVNLVLCVSPTIHVDKAGANVER